MTPEIKDMKSWKEASRWLAKHGWGMAQIEEQKTLWYADNVSTTEAIAQPSPTTKAAPEKPATVKPKTK